MAHRSRHEARWTHEDATVKGRQNRNKWWVILLGFAALMLLSTTALVRYMNFQTVDYEFLRCAAPLTEESTWDQVEAAGCQPVPAEGIEFAHFQEGSQRLPDRVEGSTISIDEIPINSPAHALVVTLDQPAGALVVAEPDNQQIRTEMSGDAEGVRWTAQLGSRGPTHYWMLLTP